MTIIRSPRHQKRLNSLFNKEVNRHTKRLEGNPLSHTVTIHSTGKVISLGEANARLTRLTNFTGMHQREIQQKFGAQTEAFLKLKSAVDLFQLGMTPKEIGKIVGKHPDTVKLWLSGKGFPAGLTTEMMEAKILSARQKTNLAEIIKSPTHTQNIGYLVGACMGNINFHRDNAGHTVVYAKVASKDFAEKIVQVSNETLKTNTKIRPVRTSEGNPVFSARIGNLDFVQFFNRITNECTRIPTNFLNARPLAKIGFLKGIMDSHANITPQKQLSIRISNPQFSEYISAELNKLGIRTSHSVSHGAQIIHIKKSDFGKFDEKLGFSDTKRSNRLKSFILN